MNEQLNPLFKDICNSFIKPVKCICAKTEDERHIHLVMNPNCPKHYPKTRKDNPMTPDEVVKHLKVILKWHPEYEQTEKTALSLAITQIQDYQKLREKDSQPLSYALFHHSFDYSSLDILLQKRTNHWFDQLDKLPEINYSLPSLQVGESPLYFENTSQFGVYNKKATTAPVTNDDVTSTRLDTKNTVSLPMKIGFIQFKPFVSSRQTFYDKGANGQTGIVESSRLYI